MGDGATCRGGEIGRPACAGRHAVLKMYKVYVLKSINRNWFYVGFTQNIIRRLEQHNSGRVKSTKHMSPYKLIYTREFTTRVEAKDFEKYLKIRSNKEKLLKKLDFYRIAEVVKLVDTQS